MSIQTITLLGLIAVGCLQLTTAWAIYKMHHRKPKPTALFLFWLCTLVISTLLFFGWGYAYIGHPPEGVWFRAAGVYMVVALTFLAAMEGVGK